MQGGMSVTKSLADRGGYVQLQPTLDQRSPQIPNAIQTGQLIKIRLPNCGLGRKAPGNDMTSKIQTHHSFQMLRPLLNRHMCLGQSFYYHILRSAAL